MSLQSHLNPFGKCWPGASKPEAALGGCRLGAGSHPSCVFGPVRSMLSPPSPLCSRPADLLPGLEQTSVLHLCGASAPSFSLLGGCLVIFSISHSIITPSGGLPCPTPAHPRLGHRIAQFSSWLYFNMHLWDHLILVCLLHQNVNLPRAESGNRVCVCVCVRENTCVCVHMCYLTVTSTVLTIVFAHVKHSVNMC